ncbi:MAG: hypothetical protein ONB17_11045, partial [candidate division KSB1 bacterium]|nr:hypothetical protein [candidate division KSB1 bacterium]
MRVRLFLGMVIASVCASGLGQTLEPLGMADYWLTCLATHDGRLFVGTSGQGVFVRDADGGQWQPLGLEGIDLRCLYPHDVGPIGWCLAAGAQPSGVGADTVLVYCWSPADSQWVPMDEGLAPQEVVAIYALDGFPDPRICGETFAGGHGGVYRRTLGGEAWERVWWRPFVEVLDLKVDPGTRTVWAVGGGTCAFTPIAAKSIDGGSTWATIFPPAPDPLLANWCLSFAFPPGSPDTVLVGMEGAVAQTTDGGKSWRFALQHEGTRFTGLAIDRGNPLHLWAAGTARGSCCRFWESFDGGRQWLRMEEVEATLGSGVVQLRADPSAPDVLYIATARNGVWRYERHSAPISR